MRTFESFVVGPRELAGRHQVSRDEIIGFAARWDPQPMHLGAGGAEPSASGIHGLAIAVRALVVQRPPTAVIAGIGMDEVRYHLPIRAGDELSVWRECVAARPSRSKPDRGVVRNLVTLVNQRREAVLSYTDIIVVRRSRSPEVCR